jgi:uncharacterized PurR-regulated membrane protein YhhQ (DUF165 family)
MAKLKIYFSGKKLALRFVASTLIASAVDSLIFGSIAFSGMMNYQNLGWLIVTMWGIKIAIEVAGLPLSLYLTHRLKTIEQLDMYDKKTNFNLFSLQVNYTRQDNHYL